MCWSATADLVAGGAITAVGIGCVSRAARTRRAALPLATLPLLLGAHQIIEAVIWNDGGGSGPATIAWAVIALPLLPLWVPVGVLCAAPRRARGRLWVPLAVGVATSAALAYVLATRTVTAEVRGHTMGYAIGLPHPAWLLAGYLLATIGSLLLSGEAGLVLLGVLAGTGAAVCAALWRWEFISTWCACAAVCSVVLYGWLGRDTTTRRPAVG
ncbi:DUF6629 family protein [Streptomyces sp. VRA16 Mangrove soil]|uniref:DUF6629 family protein n=1 Tax=Streptomyces sp. VRA16 Mangrove soil TaxID=2817434 RepID=UPI001A9D8F8A|nr:DUF6629 family protein [Streptomyces sp. VRA16 Mangrove soil]MBO1332863.1 hypothetical protein [Streptomyces sp. VRA16 Mangrove soil]